MPNTERTVVATSMNMIRVCQVAHLPWCLTAAMTVVSYLHINMSDHIWWHLCSNCLSYGIYYMVCGVNMCNTVMPSL